MPRPLLFVEKMLLRLPAGTGARIAAIIGEKGDKTSFIRAALEDRLRREEKRRVAETKDTRG